MSASAAPARWVPVVPLKPLPAAKTRLAGPALGPGLRAGLALAFAADAVAAALAATGVAGAVVVTDDPLAAATLSGLGALVVPDLPAAGLNAALEYGAAVARREFGDPGVLAMLADLPALRTSELEFAIAAAGAEIPDSLADRTGSGFRRHFIPDAEDVGTSMLFAPPGLPLAPRFGGPSRAAHLAGGARELTGPGLASLRRDVDTPADLADALRLGVGPRTSALLARDGATVAP